MGSILDAARTIFTDQSPLDLPKASDCLANKTQQDKLKEFINIIVYFTRYAHYKITETYHFMSSMDHFELSRTRNTYTVNSMVNQILQTTRLHFS